MEKIFQILTAYKWLTALTIFLTAIAIVNASSALPKGGEHDLPVHFFDPAAFGRGLAQQANQEYGTMQAVLVPHHLVASSLLSEVFSELAKQNPKRIILVGPNHHERGSGNVQASSANWNTPFGKVAGFSLSNKFAPALGETIAQEHSIAGLLPYIRYYTPQVSVTSVILKHKTSLTEQTAVATELAGVMSPNTVLISSVDFSHYLPLAIANLKDNVTKHILLSGDTNSVQNLNNDYLDSPATLSVLMQVCKSLNQPFTITNHSNSSLIFNDPYLKSTTSYFTGYC